MNYIIFLYLVTIVSILDLLYTSVCAKNIEELSNWNNTVDSLKKFCKLNTYDNQTKNKSELNEHEIIRFDYHENCCIEKIPNVTLNGFRSCAFDNNEIFLHIKYHKHMTFMNKSETTRKNEQKFKCFHTTLKSFCESLLSINIVINDSKELYLREDKSSNEWSDDSNIVRNEKSVIPLKIMISNIMWHSMQFQICNNTDKALINGKQISVKKNVILLAESSPLVINSTEDIAVQSFQREKLVLKCIIHGFPSPSIQWLKNNSTLSQFKNQSLFHTITTDFDRICTTITTLQVFNINDYVFANFCCVANNSLGKTSKTFLVDENFIRILKLKGNMKPFNVTGFIIGMMPPLLISFYIIMKLGYRSRYAQERTDEQGMNEEPFFVSY